MLTSDKTCNVRIPMSMVFHGVGIGGTRLLIRIVISPKFNEAVIPLPGAEIRNAIYSFRIRALLMGGQACDLR